MILFLHIVFATNRSSGIKTYMAPLVTINNNLKSSSNKETTTTMAETTATANAAMPGGGEPKQDAPPLEQNISYAAERIIGNGSFGVVFEAKVVETGEVVAIKKVLQDKRFKNRELQIMRQLVKDPHPNIVALKHCFYSQVRYKVKLYSIARML